jgi:DNA polymerase-1
MFRKLFEKRPGYGAVVFDAPGKKARQAKFAEYKAQRPKPPTELIEQLVWIDRLVAANNFPLIRSPGYEADDIIGTLTTRATSAGMEVLIVGGDKDLAQLVDERVRMVDTLRDITYDPELVLKKWGVPSRQIPDLLAIVGDTVDNIPGVPGVGQKGAAELLLKYGSLEGILQNLSELKGRQRKGFEEHVNDVRLWRELTVIDRDVPIETTIEALRIQPPKPSTLNHLYRELEFFSLLTEEQIVESDVKSEELHYNVCDSVDALRTALEAIPSDAKVAVVPLADMGRSVTEVEIAGIALSARTDSALYVPLGGARGLGAPAVKLLSKWFADASHAKITDSVKGLWLLLAQVGIELRGVVGDTMLASYLIDPTKCIPHRLDQVAREYLQLTVRQSKPFRGSGPATLPWRDVGLSAAANYACHLADVVGRAWAVLEERLKADGYVQQFNEQELPLALILGKMQLDGVRVDAAELERMGVEFASRKAAYEADIWSLAGCEFNVGSTKQLAAVLFVKLGLPSSKRTKTGFSTDSEVLERLAPKHEIVRHVLAHRTMTKLINTYTDVLKNAVDPVTGRIHANLQQTASASGRLISTNPDLQRTPIRTAEGRRIRCAFVADPGHKLISSDWSQIELRLLAHFSKDERLLEAFRVDRDVHRQTAGQLFKCAPEEVSTEQRNVGKTVNFATIYGQGARALAQLLGISRNEAQEYIDSYFRYYSGVRAWLDETLERALATGGVTTLFGRRRSIPELSSRNETDLQAGLRIASNTPLQGSAADLCKAAMIGISRGFAEQSLRTRMIIQIHDELVFEAPDEEVETASKVIREVMEHPYPLDVPLVVAIGVGATWGDAH